MSLTLIDVPTSAIWENWYENARRDARAARARDRIADALLNPLIDHNLAYGSNPLKRTVWLLQMFVGTAREALKAKSVTEAMTAAKAFRRQEAFKKNVLCSIRRNFRDKGEVFFKKYNRQTGEVQIGWKSDVTACFDLNGSICDLLKRDSRKFGLGWVEKRSRALARIIEKHDNEMFKKACLTPTYG